MRPIAPAGMLIGPNAYDWWYSVDRWAHAMSNNTAATRMGERRDRWISWMTLVAGAVMCVVAVLLS
jgi:hypothetical protein